MAVWLLLLLYSLIFLIMVDNKKIDALKTLQNIISRLQKNSFANKGWLIVLLTSIITASYSQPLLRSYVSVALYTLLVVLFWFCDAYYQGLACHFQKEMNRESANLNDDNYEYLTMLGNIKGIGPRNQINEASKHIFDASVFPFYLVLWGLLVIFTFCSSSGVTPKRTTTPVDSAFVEKKITEIKTLIQDSVVFKIDATINHTVELSSYIHDSLEIKKKGSVLRGKVNPCVRYKRINTCEDTIVHKSVLLDYKER